MLGLTKTDYEIIISKETEDLKRQYKEMFGEAFPPFNYDEYPSTFGMPAAKFYQKMIRESIETKTLYDPSKYWDPLFDI